MAARLAEDAAELYRRFLPKRGSAPVNRRADAVHRYQRPLKLKRILRFVNLCILAVVCTGVLGWLGFMLLAESDIFRVAEIKVRGNRMVNEHQVLDRAGLSRGASLLDVDTERVAANVRSLPWVADATVRRGWPSTVTVDVREHKPLALINLPAGGKTELYYVDMDGAVFAPVRGVSDLDFPVLTGSLLGEDLDGMRIRGDSLTGKAMQFLQLAAQGNHILPLQAVSEIQVNGGKGLVVYLVDHPFPIYLGSEKVRERYYLLVRLLAQLYDGEKVGDIKEIRMNYAEGKIMVASSGKS
jgi:hypothetical protein